MSFGECARQHWHYSGSNAASQVIEYHWKRQVVHIRVGVFIGRLWHSTTRDASL